MSHTSVSKRLKKLSIEYARENLDKLDYYKTLQIKDLERVASEAWGARMDSKIPKVIRRTNEFMHPVTGQVMETESFEYRPGEGNVKFLTEYRAALAEVREILGLNAAWEIEFSYKDNSLKEAAIDKFLVALAPPEATGTTTTIN